MNVDKLLARDRELRQYATARPWHQDGHGTRIRLVGPLPRSTVVVDPYAPNPQDSPLLLHRVNTYEQLDDEIERLRAALRELREQLAELSTASGDLPTEELYESLARELRGRISAALGEGRDAGEAALRAQSRRTVRIPGPRG
ncbi:MAG TPA: hypothetical protein VFT35_07715 [Gaiellaceae bacterium]|nr:hypothetical protein [Gaiellaceae bacterium]